MMLSPPYLPHIALPRFPFCFLNSLRGHAKIFCKFRGLITKSASSGSSCDRRRKAWPVLHGSALRRFFRRHCQQSAFTAVVTRSAMLCQCMNSLAASSAPIQGLQGMAGYGYSKRPCFVVI